MLYDGVCGLCSRLVRFLLEHDRRAVFTFAPLQGATGRSVVARFGGNPDDLTSFYVCANFDPIARDRGQKRRSALRRARAGVAVEGGLTSARATRRGSATTFTTSSREPGIGYSAATSSAWRRVRNSAAGSSSDPRRAR